MKKLILFLLLIPFTIQAQYNRDVYRCIYNTKPTVSAPTNNAISVDCVNNRVYKYVKGANRWDDITTTQQGQSFLAKGEKGDKGEQGIQGVQGIQGIQGVKGDKGDPGVCPSCPPSGGGSLPGYIVHNSNVIEHLTQIQVAGTGTNQTVGTNQYPGLTVSTSELFDEANLRYALYLGNLKRKSVLWVGKTHINGNVFRDTKNYYYVFLDGHYQAELISQNSNAFEIMGRPQPTDMNDANVMIQATWTLQNFIIRANSAQTGLAVNSTYHSKFENIMVWGGTSGFHFQFCLNGKGDRLRTGNTQKGITIDYLRIAGATASNSQSNHFSLNHSHSGGGWNGGLMDHAVAVFGSSGVFVKDAIAEGLGFKRAFINDFALSPNVKTGSFENIHPEGILGNRGCASGDALFFIRMSGFFLIDNPYMQYPGTFVNMGASGGWLTLTISNVPWIMVPGDGKYFVNTGNTFIKFKETVLYPQALASMWYVGAVATGDGNGVATVLNNGYNSGTNRYSVEANGWTSGIYTYTPSVAKMGAPELTPLEQWQSEQAYKMVMKLKSDQVELHEKLEQKLLIKSMELNVAFSYKKAAKEHTVYFGTIDEANAYAAANSDYVSTILSNK